MGDTVAAKKPAELWYEPRYRNIGRLEEFLGDTEPFWVEVVAVRFGQWINGCYSLDWTHESWPVTILRELGPGFRFGFFFVSLYIVVLARFVLGHPKVLEYGLESDNSTLRFANATVTITFVLWLVDLVLLCWSHFLVRWEGASNDDDANCTPFVRPFPRQLREVRRSKPRGARQLLEGALFAVYFKDAFAWSSTLTGAAQMAGDLLAAAVLAPISPRSRPDLARSRPISPDLPAARCSRSRRRR